MLVSLVTAMLAIDAQSPLLRLINHALRSRNKYKLTVTHLAAIFTLEARRCYFLRSLDRFAAFFGLAELKPESQELFPNSYVIGKSALLDRFVTFS